MSTNRTACGGCGWSLSGRPIVGVERRQLFDLPPVTVEVIEHQLIERECVCGQRTRVTAPAGVDAPVQYGPRIAAIVVDHHDIGLYLPVIVITVPSRSAPTHTASSDLLTVIG